MKMQWMLLLISACVAVKASDEIIYDISSQAACESITRERTGDCRWVAGLDMADLVVEKGRIIAYKIQWSGGWSDWYVPGLNDIDVKFNPYSSPCDMTYTSNSMRHMWSYFSDHTHEFIICRPRSGL
ncbi:uncharacterized protein LOC128206876 [Mya arenaria]|uniref:uncharacterized protein LOC128206876 n=1 Tax=Mya arenaria TaxID=6604 RepID=UPI0022E60E5D|nr:uncharacterized protein LOC128206876 [Mya arenaria]